MKSYAYINSVAFLLSVSIIFNKNLRMHFLLFHQYWLCFKKCIRIWLGKEVIFHLSRKVGSKCHWSGIKFIVIWFHAIILYHIWLYTAGTISWFTHTCILPHLVWNFPFSLLELNFDLLAVLSSFVFTLPKFILPVW